MQLAPSGNSVSFSGDGNESLLLFTTSTSGIVYTSFIFKITDMTGFTKGGYFAVMGDYKARLYVKPEAASQFLIGIGQTNKIDETRFSTDKFDLNQEIFLVMSYDLTTRYADVWINPAGTDFEAGTPPASDITMPNGTALEMGQFILRQDSPEETPVLGEEVYYLTEHRDEAIDVRNIRSGMHFLQVEREGKPAKIKFVIK